MSTDEINEDRPDACVVGVDYATRSGRAVLVRVRDRADLGSAVFEKPRAVITDRLPGSTQQLPPDWANTTSEVRG
jgi:L-ribulokinase